ncbi:hypothetical protein EY643_14860 [Halioglobus maricola]|uniref:Uncharacterized protein n=1 Tax=Halioglobus maricola TaxID=2601894 RepID=A0A5P9NMU8_9GAMM|nr:hypothetical protein [Halioglobus maricola]QFU76826.1 hypothetical protein EY643_14860 [Halioglobus maricola]
MKNLLKAFLVALVVVGGFTAYEVQRNAAVAKIPARDHSLKLDVNNSRVLHDLEQGRDYDSSVIDNTYTWVSRRYDASDFRLQSLARILYDYRDSITDADYQTIAETFLGFKYWMDQPGSDSMCYWSENHQLLFAASEYLAGQYWPDEVFSNSGQTGSEHLAMARERILTWLEQRWLYGFTEWYSNTYYVEDIAPLANLIDFAEDPEIVIKSQIIMDLLLYDVATQSHQGSFISSSGRMYANGKRYPERNSMQAVIDSIWDPAPWGREPSKRVGMDINFVYINNYEVPAVLKAIGEDVEEGTVIKASTGLNLDELAAEDLIGLEDRQIMMQWAIEAFSNDIIIDNTVRYMRTHNMLSNEFLHDLNPFNLAVLRYTNGLPAISRLLNPVTNGTAIQRANTYTYKTPDYMVATAQAYHPGTYGDQQHLWNAVLSRQVSVFTTHPAKPLSDKGALSGSPGYWVGSGRFPHVVQDRNVVLNIFRIPSETGFMEKSIQDYTHAHFPQERFDEVRLDGRYAFGRTGHTFGAFVALNPLHYHEDSSDDLVQPGRDAFWVFEAGSAADDGSFDAFIARVKANAVGYADGELSYSSSGREYVLRFQGDFTIDGEIQDLEYPRFDSPYVQAPRKPETLRIEYGGQFLDLDFYNRVRASGSR